MLVRRDCLKGKSCSKVEFLKDFHTFGLLSFEKSVEELMSRAKVFTFGDLDFLSVWISLVREKGTFKGRQGGRSRLWGGVAVWQGG